MTAPDERATIEVELEDELSREAIVAAKSAEEMAREIATLNRRLLLLDKRATKAAASVAALDAVTAAYTDRTKAAGTELGKVDTITKKYIRSSERASKTVTKFGLVTERTTKRVKRFNLELRHLFKIIDLGGKGLRPRTLLYLALGTAIAGAIGPVFQLGAALSSLAGFLVAVPALIDVLILSFATLAVAFKGVGEGIGAALSGSWQEFYDAQKDLAPSAQHFLKVLRKFRNEYKGIRMAVQEAFFSPFSKEFQPFLKRQLPIFKKGATMIGRTMGETVAEVFKFFASDLGASSVETLFQNTENFWQNIRMVATPIMAGFARLVNNTADSFDRMTDIIIGKWGTQLANFLDRISEGGENSKANQWLDTAILMGGQLLELFQSIGRILLDISQAAGGMSFGPLQVILDVIEGFTGSAEGQAALSQFFESLRAVMSALAPVVVALGSAIGTQLVPILEDIIIAIAPYIAEAVTLIGDALETTRPMWGLLADAAGKLLVALAPLLPPLAQLLVLFGTQLAVLAETLAPVINLLLTHLLEPLRVWLTVMAEAWTANAPLIIRVVDEFGKAIAELTPFITEIGDLFIEVFLDFVAEMMPLWIDLLPLFLDLAKILSEELVTAITELKPLLPDLIDSMFKFLKLLSDPKTQKLIFKLIELFIQIVGIFLKDFIPATVTFLGIGIKLLTWFFDIVGATMDAAAAIGDFVGKTINWFKDLGTKLGTALKPIVNTLLGPFKTAFNAIADAWNNTVGKLSWTVPDWVPNIGGKTISAPKIPKLEKGGPAFAGQNYMVGEAGKELFFPGDGGPPEMIGQHGTEIRDFDTSGFVIPNRMVRAMESASASMARELARMEGAHNSSADRAAEMRALASVGAGGDTFNITQHFNGANMTPRDVEKSVKSAIRKIEQEKKERT